MKSTKKALFMSCLSLLLCVSMLVGTTFAWFTDTVTSGVNQIVAGNLDIELEYSKDMTEGSWKTVEEATQLFEDVSLWEPGAVSVVYLRFKNVGTLALKYNLAVKVRNETPGTNVHNDSFNLSDYIKFGQQVDVTTPYADRAAAIAAVDAFAKPINQVYQASGVMVGKTDTETSEKILALVVYMPTEVSDVANYRGNVVPTIEMGIHLDATQMTIESDSFDNQYDFDAEIAAPALPPVSLDPDTNVLTINDATGYLAYANGDLSEYGITGNVKALNAKLGADIDFGNQQIGHLTVTALDGDGHSIKNAKADDYLFTGYNEGILGTVKNLTLENITITGTNQNNIGIFGSDTISRQANFTDIIIKNCTVDGTNSEYAGAFIGNVAYSTFTNCKVIDCNVSAKKNAGSIIGMAQTYGNDTTLTNCSAEGGSVTITATGRNSIGSLVGRAITPEGGVITLTGCSATGVTLNNAGTAVAEPTLVGDTAGYSGVTVNSTSYLK